MPDAEPEIEEDLEERFLANREIQAAMREAEVHPERRVPRRDRTAEREALRGREGFRRLTPPNPCSHA